MTVDDISAVIQLGYGLLNLSGNQFFSPLESSSSLLRLHP